jgi:hypothetical protein
MDLSASWRSLVTEEAPEGRERKRGGRGKEVTSRASQASNVVFPTPLGPCKSRQKGDEEGGRE